MDLETFSGVSLSVRSRKVLGYPPVIDKRFGGETLSHGNQLKKFGVIKLMEICDHLRISLRSSNQQYKTSSSSDEVPKLRGIFYPSNTHFN